MSFVINPNILNLLGFFGICPYKYNNVTKTIDCTNFRLIYSCTYFLITSVVPDCLAFMVLLEIGITEPGTYTYKISKIIESTSRSVIHTLCIIDIIFRRRAFVSFMNNLNNFQKNIEFEVEFKANTKSEYVCSLVVIILLICYFLSITTIGIAVYFNFIVPIVFVYVVLGSLKYISFLSIGVNICILNMILLHRYQCVFNKIDTLTKIKPNEEAQEANEVFKSLIQCFKHLEELNTIKLKMSDLFGSQILLIVTYHFVLMTIALYFSIFKWFLTKSVELFNFVTFNWPSLAILLWMVVLMNKLGEQVNEMKKRAIKVSAIADKRLSASIDLFFLKIQHMEKRKYVTANDYFDINYRMLYNMTAAIITHIMIILQFQQWEDSQKRVT